MKNIIVAGAGHGGLVAAAYLAKSGFDVTVYEKNKREEMGHDWEDRFTFELLLDIIGKKIDDLPEGSWRYRGDCAFVSPAKRKRVEIFYNDENRQKIMKRKALIALLIENAEKNGAKFEFENEILAPIIENKKVTGIKTAKGEKYADLVIDAAGVFSPLRTQLPDSFGIERMPKRGDLFYAWRAYFDKCDDVNPKVPFEVYMYHEGEQGLSWFCTNENTVDILIGRIDKFGDEKVEEQLDIFRKDHPWTGENIVNGGNYGIIPVRRPLTLMVADGYAAIGDSAFMTMPMNGMGIDLSLEAGVVLSKVIASHRNEEATKEMLWEYNRRFHIEYGGFAAKNEGLKNAILSIPSKGVDFLFENEVIQSSDLAGAGRNTNFASLLGKLKRGMKDPPYFIALINGLIKGGKASKAYCNPPEKYDKVQIAKWNGKIVFNDITIV